MEFGNCNRTFLHLSLSRCMHIFFLNLKTKIILLFISVLFEVFCNFDLDIIFGLVILQNVSIPTLLFESVTKITQKWNNAASTIQ